MESETFDRAAFADALLTDLCTRFPMGYRPALVWRGYRVSAGKAYYQVGRIGLSYHVLQTEAQIRDTLVHEYAHLLAVHRHGVAAANHGPHWQRAMHDLGANPERTHSYEVHRLPPQRTLVYRCVRCKAEIRRTRRLPGGRRFLHNKCGGAVQLDRIETTNPDANP